MLDCALATNAHVTLVSQPHCNALVIQCQSPNYVHGYSNQDGAACGVSKGPRAVSGAQGLTVVSHPGHVT